jgi:hypothetical protein
MFSYHENAQENGLGDIRQVLEKEFNPILTDHAIVHDLITRSRGLSLDNNLYILSLLFGYWVYDAFTTTPFEDLQTVLSEETPVAILKLHTFRLLFSCYGYHSEFEFISDGLAADYQRLILETNSDMIRMLEKKLTKFRNLATLPILNTADPYEVQCARRSIVGEFIAVLMNTGSVVDFAMQSIDILQGLYDNEMFPPNIITLIFDCLELVGIDGLPEESQAAIGFLELYKWSDISG